MIILSTWFGLKFSSRILGPILSIIKDSEKIIQDNFSSKIRVIEGNNEFNFLSKVLNKMIEKLKVQIPEIVYVYSQNSALSFLNMIKNYNLQNSWMNTNLMCISEKTSTVLNEIKWKKIFLFNPGEEEFLLYKI